MGTNNGNAVPRLTPEQRAGALEKAMAARMARAAVKRGMKLGEISIKRALGLDVMQRARVREVIAAMPGHGKAKADELMRELGISPRKRVGGLGRRQRAALLGVFGYVD